MIVLNEKEQLARSKIILPLDRLYSWDVFQERVEELSPITGIFKIGFGSFFRFGLTAIDYVREKGAEVLLDLKFKDKPKTVEDVAYAAASRGVYMMTLHIDGGTEMVKAAIDGARLGGKVRVPKILGVTVLTSMDDSSMQELGISANVSEQVVRYALLAQRDGLDGIVCSALDISAVKEKITRPFIYATPGIRAPDGKVATDQKRVLTPGLAVHAGATYIIPGDAITGRETSEARLEAGYNVIRDMVPYL